MTLLNDLRWINQEGRYSIILKGYSISFYDKQKVVVVRRKGRAAVAQKDIQKTVLNLFIDSRQWRQGNIMGSYTAQGCPCHIYFQYPPPMVLLKLKFLNKKRGVLCLLPAAFCRCTSNRAISAGVIPGIREACPIVAGRMLPSLMTASFLRHGHVRNQYRRE